MRIIGGAWRGRTLVAPVGPATRPTSERARQATFDMLAHAPWAGRSALSDATVLDAFAGSGALGLEALSRGAASAAFMDTSRAALDAIRANLGACRATATVFAADATRPPRATAAATLVFLDPPYGQALVPRALVALATAGWLAPGALLVAETGRDEPAPFADEPLARRTHGAATLWFGRSG